MRLETAETLPPEVASPAPRGRADAPGTALHAEPKVIPMPRPRPAQRRLSYSQLQDYARCGYRYYLTRVLGLPRVTPPPPDDLDPAEAETPAPPTGNNRGGPWGDGHGPNAHHHRYGHHRGMKRLAPVSTLGQTV